MPGDHETPTLGGGASLETDVNQETLAAQLGRTLDSLSLPREDPLAGVNGNMSLGSLDLLLVLEEDLSIHIDDSLWVKLVTFQDIISYLLTLI